MPNIGAGSNSPAASATPPMMRSTIALRLIALEMASRTFVEERVLAVGAGDAGRIALLVDMQIDDAVRQALDDLEAGLLDAVEVLDRRRLDQVDVAREQRGDARRVAGDRPE